MNLKLNDLFDKVKTYHYALGNKNKEVIFLHNHANDGGSKIYPKKKNYRYFFDKPIQKKVKMIRLDDHSKSNYDFILMDLEGAEFLALQGMTKKLKSCKVLQMEYNFTVIKEVIGKINLTKLVSILINAGFNFVKILGDRKKIVYSSDKFYSFFEYLNRKDKYVDLLFYKK